jgi:hypothetical protein
VIGWLGAAWADDPADVVEVVGHGVEIDWTTLRLEVSAGARGAGPQAIEAIEQLARRSVEAAYQQAVGSVRITADARVADLVADGELGAAVRSRISRWEVDEATYTSTGRVDLHAVLSLQDLLRPWALQIARSGVPPLEEGGPTGLVIDARGTDLAPAYALRLVAPDGGVLYAGELWEERAVSIPPYRFVADPAHPAAAEAGANPVMLVATGSRGADLYLSPSGVHQLAEAGDGLLGRVTVIVVVDGP